MNIPVNFDKINGRKFVIDGNEYEIEADFHDPGDVWIWARSESRWPLCMDIDWNKGTYALIKCEPGRGRVGNVLATDAPLLKHLIKDADSFINIFVKDIVNTLITNRLF